MARTVQEVKCPDWRHRNSRVWRHGSYARAGKTYQRYLCHARTGTDHTFSVLRDADGVPHETAQWQAPPPCADHPKARHVRDGHYGAKSGRPRQRYRCYGNGKKRGHAYTPAVPRAYVGKSSPDPCDLCDEPRSVHRGEPANSRRHTWWSRLVAEGLIFLSRGEPYGEVGRWATRNGPPRIARKNPAPTQKHPDTAEANRRWHIAADWVECYSPVFWEPLEARMKEAALRERRRIDAELADGKPLSRPIIWVADELKVFGQTDERFDVLVVAEAEWRDESPQPQLRLRVARAMPDRTTEAWLLVFDELARVPGETDEIWPDFLVADGAKPIRDAAALRFGGRTRWVPSTWHLAHRIRLAVLGKEPPRGRLPDEEIEEHLDQLTRDSEALATVAGWGRWWDRLDVLLAGKSWVRTQRPLYEPAYAAVIPALATAHVAISSAGLEELIKSKIAPLFYKRSGFTSIERTNRLTDLAVCAARFELETVGKVARRLRADAREHGGWTTALRAIADPTDPDSGRPYKSLRDRSLSKRLLAGAA